MIRALLFAAALSVTPPPGGAYVEVRQQGATQGYARVVNCIGSSLCGQDGGVMTMRVGVDGGTCPANQFVTGVDNGAVPGCAQVNFTNLAGTLSNAQRSVLKITGSNVSMSSTTPATLGLSWTATTGAEYAFHCMLLGQGTTTSLPKWNITGTVAISTNAYAFDQYTTTSARTFLVVSTLSGSAQTAGCTSSCSTAALPTYIDGQLTVGFTGTVDVQVSSSTAGQTVTVLRGSYCEVF
jgi:hypothetical protein